MPALSNVRVMILAAAFAALLLAACGGDRPDRSRTVQVGGESGTERAERQVLRRGNGAEPQSLDPHKTEGVPEAHLLRDLFEGLTIERPDNTTGPGAAESWEISDDGLVYTFRLREDARWSNGDPVTAADFEYGLRRSVDPRTLSNYGIMLRPIVNAAEVIAGELPPDALGVEATGEHTLEIRLHHPAPYFLGVLSHSAAYPVHRATVERHDGERWARPGRMVSNGAYRLEEWTPQSHIKLLRNEHHWDNDNTSIDEVWFYPIENQSTELQRYRANELDMTYEIPYRQLRWIRENLSDELKVHDYLGTYYYGLNVTREPFVDNVKLRRALALAINRERITEQVTAAGELPAYGWVPEVQNYTQQQPEWATWTQAEREAEARRLYEAAGYSPDEPLRLQILYNTHENHRTIAVAISSMWNEVLGVRTDLVNEEWRVYLETRRSKETTQVFRAGWIGDYNDAFTFAELMHSQSAMNDSGWVNADYDALLERAGNEPDIERRAAYLEQAERVLLDEMPLIPIYFYVTTRLVKPWVGGYDPNNMDHVYTRDLYVLSH